MEGKNVGFGFNFLSIFRGGSFWHYEFTKIEVDFREF